MTGKSADMMDIVMIANITMEKRKNESIYQRTNKRK